MVESIKSVLMARDDMTAADADAAIADAREALIALIEDGDFSAAEDVCLDHFGLEPDYLEELLPL